MHAYDLHPHMHRLIRFAFSQFYTRFAWTYDTVAGAVSFGEWKRWGEAALDFVPDGARVLEIAHGPGHLHLSMRNKGWAVTGLDLSPQMGRMTRRRVLRATGHAPDLLCASALRLPFADAHFERVISTFPAEFVFHPDVLRDVRRVLTPGGSFVIVPSARFRHSGPLTTLVESAYRITGQRAGQDQIEERVAALMQAAGLSFSSKRVETPRAVVTVWVCQRN
jgi:ubiquinone/menaquinone biosynthesis C-methylase UbiE